MDFAEVFIELSKHMNGMSWSVTGIESHPDLKGFGEQETSMALFPVEWVKQIGCGDYGYHGTIYFPTTYPNGDGGVMHIRVEFTD